MVIMISSEKYRVNYGILFHFTLPQVTIFENTFEEYLSKEDVSKMLLGIIRNISAPLKEPWCCSHHHWPRTDDSLSLFNQNEKQPRVGHARGCKREHCINCSVI